MGTGRVVGQSRCFRKSRPLLRLNRPSDGSPSPNTASHAFERSAPHCGTWSAASSLGAGKTRLEECEGHYQAHLCCGRAARLLGRTWLFPLRRNLIEETHPMTHPISEPRSHPQGEPMRSAVERIAAFAAAARPAQLTSGIRHLFKRNILDSLGCAISALAGQPFHALREQFEEYRAPGRCTLIGGGKTSADHAALFNSGLVRYVDLLDSYMALADSVTRATTSGPFSR